MAQKFSGPKCPLLYIDDNEDDRAVIQMAILTASRTVSHFTQPMEQSQRPGTSGLMVRQIPVRSRVLDWSCWTMTWAPTLALTS